MPPCKKPIWGNAARRCPRVDADIAIVGGGIVGTTATIALQDAGLRTILFEPNDTGAGTAEGSAAYLHDGEIFPLPHPSLLPAIPRMLLDRNGPLVFRAQYLPHIVGWSMRFLQAMNARTYAAGTQALASLNRLSIGAMLEMAAAAGASELIVRGGGLKVCSDPRSVIALEKELQELERYGIAGRILDAAAVRELEPGIAAQIAGGAFFADSGHCIDVVDLGKRFASLVRRRGTVVSKRVSAVRADGNAWVVDDVKVPRVLVAAGHASPSLLEPLGYRVPIAPARGYHLMLHDSGVALRHPVIFHEQHFAATPMRAGLRLAGTMEFAAAASAPDTRRAEMLYDLALPYLPGMRKMTTATWMGVRPLTPDDLPIIGEAPRHRGIYYSSGHGHLGFTQSAISGRCIADLVTGRTPRVDLTPFSLARFN